MKSKLVCCVELPGENLVSSVDTYIDDGGLVWLPFSTSANSRLLGTCAEEGLRPPRQWH
jgi:hypothetical protein